MRKFGGVDIIGCVVDSDFVKGLRPSKERNLGLWVLSFGNKVVDVVRASQVLVRLDSDESELFF
ncbi:unnamed protein product [Prunus armeniaca]